MKTTQLSFENIPVNTMMNGEKCCNVEGQIILAHIFSQTNRPNNKGHISQLLFVIVKHPCQHLLAKWELKRNIPFRFSLSTWLSSSLIFYQDQWDIKNGYIVSNSILATEASEDISNRPFPTNIRFTTDLEIPCTAGKDKRNINIKWYIYYIINRAISMPTQRPGKMKIS